MVVNGRAAAPPPTHRAEAAAQPENIAPQGLLAHARSTPMPPSMPQPPPAAVAGMARTPSFSSNNSNWGYPASNGYAPGGTPFSSQNGHGAGAAYMNGYAAAGRGSAPAVPAAASPTASTTSSQSTSTGMRSSSVAPRTPDSASSAAVSSSATDMSLMQYSRMQHGGGSTPGRYMNGANLSIQVPNGGLSNGSSGASTPTGADGNRTPPGAGAVRTPTGAAPRSSYVGRSITPLRYVASANQASAYGGVMASHPPQLNSPTGSSSIVAGVASRAPGSGGVVVSRSMPSMANGSGAGLGRAPSADRAAVLRATIHTDMVRAAPRGPLPERNAQSAEGTIGSINSGGSGSPMWRGGNGASSTPSAPIPTTPKAPAPGHRPGAGVARTLAPNGQPRKIPIAMLPQYHAGIGARAAGALSGALSAPVGPAAAGGGVAAVSVLNGGGGQPDMYHISRLKNMSQLRYNSR